MVVVDDLLSLMCSWHDVAYVKWNIEKCNRDLEYRNVVYVSCPIDGIFYTLTCRDVVQ